MLNVTFMRHAKSDWNIYDGNDFNRCVSEEGINKTKRIGLFIKNNNFFFDEALCSPALENCFLGPLPVLDISCIASSKSFL